MSGTAGESSVVLLVVWVIGYECGGFGALGRIFGALRSRALPADLVLLDHEPHAASRTAGTTQPGCQLAEQPVTRRNYSLSQLWLGQ